MKRSFQCLPFFLYLGIAGQAGGLYLFAMFVPWLIMRKIPHWLDQQLTCKLGLLLVASWLVFPGINILNAFFPLWDLPLSLHGKSLTFAKLMTSQLSSVWGISGFMLLFLGKRKQLELKSQPIPEQPTDQAAELFQGVITGFVFATTLFGIYMIIQHVTGFDYRLEGGFLGDNRLMGAHRYRVSGFWGHPLSAAAVTLAIFSYFWFLTFGSRDWTSTLPSLTLSRRFAPIRGNGYRLCTAFIAVTNLGMLVITGGRTAILVGLAWACIIPVVLQRHRLSWMARVMVLMVLFISIALGGYFSGSHFRFLELITQFRDGTWLAVDRFKFWMTYATMIADNPYYGHGTAHISAWVRDAYYNSLGFAQYHQKYNAHNIYLELMASVGVLGIFVLGAMAVSGFRILSQWSQKSDTLRQVFGAMLVALVANACHGLTQNVFFDTNVLAIYLGFFWIYFWMVSFTK